MEETMNNGMLNSLQDDEHSYNFIYFLGGLKPPRPLVNPWLRISFSVFHTTQSGRYNNDFCRSSSYHRLAAQRYLHSQQVWFDAWHIYEKSELSLDN